MTAADRFDRFVRTDGHRIHRVLVAAHGPAVGGDAAQTALEYGWRHWDRVESMENPAGYLYRIGSNAARKESGRDRTIGLQPGEAAGPDDGAMPRFEPGLHAALDRLSERQRIAVVLIHGHGYRLAEVADVLDVTVSTLRNHLQRGLEKLRNELGVEHANV